MPFTITMHNLFSLGNVYIAEGSRIRKVTVSTGIITTIAGTGNGNGDGVQATSVEIFGPYSIALDSSGSNTFTFLLPANLFYTL